MKTIRDIYDKIVSCYAQFADIHDDLESLNMPGLYSTTETDQVCEDWMIEGAENAQAVIGRLSDRFWQLPCVNLHDDEEKKKEEARKTK